MDHQDIFQCSNSMLPSVCCNKSVVLQLELLKVYQNKVDFDLLEAEFSSWKSYWDKKVEYYHWRSALKFHFEFKKEFYPNILTLLKIYSTFPVTTCTPERTFLNTKETDLYRNARVQDWLSGLALTSVHRSTTIATNEVINIFASRHSRRLNFVL